MAGVIDEPINSGEDQLGIKAYSQALTDFIKTTKTPIAIGIQGEWGSGKTSLLNDIWSNLESTKFETIWINTWEFSLLSSPEEALVKILTQLTHEIIAIDPNEDKFKKAMSICATLVKGTAKISAGVIGGRAAANTVGEMLTTAPSNNPIKELRDTLVEAINHVKKRKKIEGFVFFIDDLDRIEPKEAVKILELLKNIFSINSCIFILAIDYQVVIKGLREKFGDMTAANEWEFRAFFDKIIQVPFTMPMGSYKLGKYVSSLLKQINYLSSVEEEDENTFEEIVQYTIGGNPRSLKRLANSLCLINLFMTKKVDDKDKVLLFAIVCLQVAYPKLYEKLQHKPSFITWDKNDVYEFTKGYVKEDKEEAEMAFKTQEFDEEWEQNLYKMCYPFPQLKSKVINISKLFSWIREYINDNSQLGEILNSFVENTSITSVSSEVVQNKKGGRKFLQDFNEYLDHRYASIDLRNLVKSLEMDLKAKFNSWRFVYSLSEGMIVYASESGHSKVFSMGIEKSTKHIYLFLHRDKQHEYRKPLLAGAEVSNSYISSYNLKLPSIEVYEKNKLSIYELINASARMKADRGSMLDMVLKVSKELPEKYLAEDYTYEAKVENSLG